MTTNDIKAVTTDSVLYNRRGTIYTEIYAYGTPWNHVTQKQGTMEIN